MRVANGAIGRELVALARRSPLELIETFAWVGHYTTFEDRGPAHVAATLVTENGRRDVALAGRVDAGLDDLRAQAARGELMYSINDYAVLVRKPLRGP